MYKVVLTLLMLLLAVILAIILILKVAEHAAGMANSGSVNKILNGVGYYPMLHARTRKISTGHS